MAACWTKTGVASHHRTSATGRNAGDLATSATPSHPDVPPWLSAWLSSGPSEAARTPLTADSERGIW